MSDEEHGATAPLVSIHPGATSLLALSRRTVYGLLEAGELESVRVGRRRLVVRESIDEYVARLRRQSA